MRSFKTFRRNYDQRSKACHQTGSTNPVRPRRACETSARSLIAVPASTPSLRLLADQTAKVMAGISDALSGLALLVGAPTSPVARGRGYRLRVPDWLPSLVNAGRAFVAIIIIELFWIMTEWPNGAFAITFTAIGVLLFAPRADQAYATAKSFMVGNVLATVFTAVIAFAVLPGLETFEAFSLAIGLYLVPVGALMARWQTAMFLAMAANFVPLLAPANLMSYDTVQFYNSALAIIAGSGVAAVSFRLLPPLPPAFRTRRLLALTLRDLRHLATGPIPSAPGDWEGRIYGRLAALPDTAQPLQRSQLLAALSVGNEYHPTSLSSFRAWSGLGSRRGARGLSEGNSAVATTWFRRIDDRLSSLSDNRQRRPLL